MVLHNRKNTNSNNQTIRKPKTTTSSEINIINYLNKRTNLNKTETDLLNRKRCIQMLDLFNSKYDCKICCRKLRYKADQIIHAKLKHNPACMNSTRIQCPLCEAAFTSYFKLKFHLMKLHLDEKPYKCKECSSRFHSFLLLRKHCYARHLSSASSLTSSFSSSYNSSLSSSSSSEKSFIDFIDYDNSNIAKQRSSLLPDSFTNPLSFNSDLNLKYFHQLNKINKSKNIDSLLDYLNDSKQANLNENTFTIITQLESVIDCNLCSKVVYSNSEYLNHVWQEHLVVNKSFSSQFICWACVLANKTCPINTIDKYKFNSLADLSHHSAQFKHTHQKGYKCSLCADVYFDDLNVCKEHYLSEHTPSEAVSKSYLDDILDLATNFDSEPSINGKSLKKPTRKSYKFVFACFKCEQIYSSHDCILNHFLTNCGTGSLLSRTKCSQCSLTFTNIKQIEIHLKQHDYLAFNELLNKKNIKNSKNNKSYSIDSIVNSNSTTGGSNRRIDDIASKIMKKSQETSNLFNTSLATSFLFNFQQHFNDHANSTKKLFDFNNENSLNQYTDLLSKMIKTNEPFYLNNNLIRKPSAFYSSSSASSSGLLNSNPFLFSMPGVFKLDTPASKCDHTETETSKQVKCDYCGYGFSCFVELNEHKQMHQALNPKRPFKCHLCQVTFAKTDQLMRHMIVHQASELDSVCQVCYSSFSRKQDLDRHMLFHSK